MAADRPRSSLRPFASHRPAAVPSVRPLETEGWHVLLVDDDALVRRAVARALRRRYTVTEISDAETAYALVEGGAWFDAIVCDLHLEGMSGRELLLKLEETHPLAAKRVAILSGTPCASMDDEFIGAISTRFLEKPATMSELDEMIRTIAGAAARAA